ncbi:MAG TPA: hypothetical protein VGW39_14670 [Chthoniobacterales bacterium]|nr:hypothetical protein [Chthoniobacterales bacterium]
MDQQVKVFTVFIASPNDLGDERQALRDVVERINSIVSKETDLRIELLGWEDTLPGRGRPQELINADLDKADLFIGCLWKKMGSLSGLRGRTGFEEEFYRALERNGKSGWPELWVFFKEVDSSDPGEHLRRVLQFRAEQVEGKQLLFREFKEAADWELLVNDLLLRRVLKLITAKQAAPQEAQSTSALQSKVHVAGASADAPKPSRKTAEAFTQLADLLDAASNKMRSGLLLSFTKTDALQPSETARLLLFATTNYDWHSERIQLGTHEINSAYWHREALKLSGQERLFILRTLLLDSSLTKPGWFWVDGWGVRTALWLHYLAISDSDELAREATVNLATRTNFPLFKGKKGEPKPIVQILTDKSETVRSAGLNYIAAHGRIRDLATLDPVFRDASADIRAKAERVARLIRLREDPDGETKKSIEQSDIFDEPMLAALSADLDKISNETLRAALLHPTGMLRAFAAKELLCRGSVTQELGRILCVDSINAIKECGYVALAKSDADDPSLDIRKALASHFLTYESDWEKADPNAVINARFDRLPPDALWQRVAAFDRDSHLALRALGRRHFATARELIRAEVDDEFRKKAIVAESRLPKTPELPNLRIFMGFGRSDPVEDVRESLLDIAIEILAGHPDVHDRPLYLGSLSNDLSKAPRTVACLSALAAVGNASDREAVKPLITSEGPLISVSAAAAYFKLSPSAVLAAKDVLLAPSEHRVWIVVLLALQSNDKSIWPVLEHLLGSENSDIRRIVAYYATEILPNAHLKTLLDNYLNRGRYFYDVVVLLDRTLYAPSFMKRHLRLEEREYLRKWELGGFQFPPPRALRPKRSKKKKVRSP